MQLVCVVNYSFHDVLSAWKKMSCVIFTMKWLVLKQIVLYIPNAIIIINLIGNMLKHPGF